PHVPWVLNERGEVIEASSRWEEITGQPLADAVGRGWLKMVHPDDVGPANGAIRHCLRTGEPIDVRFRVRRPDGAWLPMRSRGSARFDALGKIVGVYGVVEAVAEPAVESREEWVARAV
ncbi:MAG: PAS domain-containing protein, partial [Acidobacteriaceae bacterium]